MKKYLGWFILSALLGGFLAALHVYGIVVETLMPLIITFSIASLIAIAIHWIIE